DLQLPLMHGAGPGNAARQNLSALRHERANELHVLVVDIVNLVCAELADLAAPEQRTPLTLGLVAALCGLAAAGPTASTLSECHLPLHPVIPLVVVIELVDFGRPSLARLSHRRQPALDAAPLRVGLSLRPRPLDDFFLAVDAGDEVTHNLVHHAEPT